MTPVRLLLTPARLLLLLLLGPSLLIAGCDSTPAASAPPAGSTLQRTLVDPDGDGRLESGPGEPLRDRRELGASGDPGRTLATFAQLTDLHIRDEESPARVPFLDRVGEPFTSAFRPHEALSAQVATAAVRAVNRARPQAVLVTGDLIDSAQINELDTAVTVLDGGRVRPDSGARGYDGVQEAGNPDPLYYRPDNDAPRHPGLPARAQQPFSSPGLDAPWLPVLGNHDLLVQGEVAPTAELNQAATGTRAFVSLKRGTRPPDESTDPAAGVRALLDGTIPARETSVPADPDRRHVGADAIAARLGRSTLAGRLDYAADIGPHLRAIVLDSVRREGGSGGMVSPAQVAWLREQVAAAGRRWVVVVAHQPLKTAEGGEAALLALDTAPRMAAVITGHTHRNAIEPRATARGGYWLVSTSSLADFPQQARGFRLRRTSAGGAALETWMIDHDGAGLAGTARELAFLDAQGGRPQAFAGTATDRNVRLHLPPAR